MEDTASAFSGYEIFSGYVERLFCGYLSPQLSVSERQDLERRVNNLNPQQKKRVLDRILAMELASEFFGNYDDGEYWAAVAAYFARRFPVRDFAVIK